MVGGGVKLSGGGWSEAKWWGVGAGVKLSGGGEG